MRVGCLISGGKDSIYASWLAKKSGHKLSCLITIVSKNLESYMFHTPSIGKVKMQAQEMGIPLLIQDTKGKKEGELKDLEKVIKIAIKKYKIQGIVTGAVESVYQASRIQKICNKLGIECFNPLWQKNQEDLIQELIKNKFEIILTGVFAYPLNFKWVGRKIDLVFLEEMKKLNSKYGISVAGEGGEFESFVLNCPLFRKKLAIESIDIKGDGYSYSGEVSLKK